MSAMKGTCVRKLRTPPDGPPAGCGLECSPNRKTALQSHFSGQIMQRELHLTARGKTAERGPARPSNRRAAPTRNRGEQSPKSAPFAGRLTRVQGELCAQEWLLRLPGAARLRSRGD